MTQQTIEAIYENGVFRVKSAESLGFREGQQVTIIVETEREQMPLSLLTSIYEGLTEQEIDEIEKIVLDRSTFFTDRLIDE